MRRCLITYQPSGEEDYSQEGLRLLNRNLRHLHPLPWSAQEQIRIANEQAGKLSIGGVQPKLSARLNLAKEKFEPVEKKGRYILKPPHPSYLHVPENEDLTMRMAAFAGIETPLHGLVNNQDGTRTYFIERFDRFANGRKISVEDFAQLSEVDRETKYESSMERVAKIIEEHSSFPVIDKLKLFRRLLFSFLVGNEDMHLKNFSLIRRKGKRELSPAYDLLNTTIILKGSEELALPLRGKKSRLKKSDFVDYFAEERLGIPKKWLDQELKRFTLLVPGFLDLIDVSFLSEEEKEQYRSILKQRYLTLELDFG